MTIKLTRYLSKTVQKKKKRKDFITFMKVDCISYNHVYLMNWQLCTHIHTPTKTITNLEKSLDK